MAIYDDALTQALSGVPNNAYLGQQAAGIAQNVTRNLQNTILPGVNSGAQSAGQYGGSRQGIAQGLAITNANQDIANAQANLYGNAYQQAAQLQSATANNLAGLDAQKAMQQAQLQSQWDIAGMNDATARLGLQNQFALGLGGLANQAFANYTSRLGTLGGLSNQAFANDTSRMGTLGALDNQAYSNETTRGLGLGNLGLNYAQLGQQGQQWNDEFNRQVYNDAYSQNMNNLQVGMNLLGMLNSYNNQDFGLGTTVRNAPLDYLTQFTNLNSTIGRGGQTTTTAQSGAGGNPLTGALGGAQLGKAAQDWWGTQSGSNAPPSGYSSWDQYNYGMGSGGSDNLSVFGNLNNWWGK